MGETTAENDTVAKAAEQRLDVLKLAETFGNITDAYLWTARIRQISTSGMHFLTHGLESLTFETYRQPQNPAGSNDGGGIDRPSNNINYMLPYASSKGKYFYTSKYFP